MADKKSSSDLQRLYQKELQRPWGSQSYSKVRRNSTTMKILKGVALAGAVLIAASNPYFGQHLMRAFKKERDRKQWRKLQQSLRYLKSRGYVRIISVEAEGINVEITRAGEKVVKQV